MSILCTRNITDEELLMMKAMDQQYDIIPFIALHFSEEEQIKSQVEKLVEEPIIAIFTSPAAVHAVQHFINATPSDWQIICTEPRTRQLLEEWLGQHSILHSGIDAAAILPYFSTLSQNRRIIVFRGDKSLPSIPKALHLHGFEFETIEVYRNIAQPQRLQQDYDYYLFYSPSAVAAFLMDNSIPDDKLAIAIGKTTKAYLEKNNIRNIVAASTPDLASMLQLIKNYELKK